jgi:hypothetical protein
MEEEMKLLECRMVMADFVVLVLWVVVVCCVCVLAIVSYLTCKKQK